MISRRKFFQSLLGAAAAGLVLDYHRWNGVFSDRCAVRTVTVPAPAGWAGKTALFITDIHYDYFFGSDDAAALNTQVRTLRPDLVLMGGDLAQTPDTDLDGFLACWSPGCPTIFAPGNHDTDGVALSRVLVQAQRAGLVVLCNASETWNGLKVIGLSSALRAPQRTSLLASPGLKVVLGHEPDMWDQYDDSDLLHLAGHTHGGQICPFGRPLILPTLGQKYSHGKFVRPNNSTLVVSAGIGCMTIPIRLRCPPEIVQLRFT